MEKLHYNQMVHESSSQSHASFPIIAVAIIGIFATIFLLLFYYIFFIKCCLNWNRIDILRRFSVSRNTNHHQYHHSLLPHHHHHHPSSPAEPRGLHESVIRSIPIFHFQKQKDSDDFTGECSVCLAEFQHDEKLRMIPNCAHVFHIDCIDVWLQNNPNCPLCRNSVSVSIPSHFPVPENPRRNTSPASDEEDYVVIELCSSHGGDGGNGGEGGSTGINERRNFITGEEERLFSGEPIGKKIEKKLRKKQGYVLSMGDECIDANYTRRKGDDQFVIQPIRRSFSMDSASDRQLYLAVQEIIQRNSMMNHVSDECSSSNGRLRRGLFSFGHARSVVLPLNSKP